MSSIKKKSLFAMSDQKCILKGFEYFIEHFSSFIWKMLSFAILLEMKDLSFLYKLTLSPISRLSSGIMLPPGNLSSQSRLRTVLVLQMYLKYCHFIFKLSLYMTSATIRLLTLLGKNHDIYLFLQGLHRLW